MKVYRYSKKGFKLQKQTAWIKFLKDLKRVDSFTKERSFLYWLGVRFMYKILFKKTMLAKALESHSVDKIRNVYNKPNVQYYNILETGKSILTNLDPETSNRSVGVWVFLSPPTERDLNRNVFTEHCGMNLYKADISDDTMAFVVFGNLLTYKSLKEHKLDRANAVFIPNPQISNVELVDKKKEDLDYEFVDNFYGYKKKYIWR